MSRDVRGHEDLEVWKNAMAIAVEVYQLTRCMPREERFGLTAQIRSAAVSVTANIAEGAARNSTADLARLLAIATGSLSELDTELPLAQRLGFPRYPSALRDDVKVTQAMLTHLRRSLIAARTHDVRKI